MSRFIDADALLEDIRKNSESYFADDFAHEWVDKQPTADVVEVVRCKDCKYMCSYIDGHIECRLLADLKPIPTTYCTMKIDDYCSYGERREDGI